MAKAVVAPLLHIKLTPPLTTREAVLPIHITLFPTTKGLGSSLTLTVILPVPVHPLMSVAVT